MKNKSYLTLLLACACSLCLAESKSSTSSEQKEVTEMDVADLLNVQVTSVSKKAQALSDAPSAIFVISNEDIKRTGVTSVPEALRMAPGIDVARINSNKWAVSARGFNGGFANKLLVLIDGRSVYTPAFSGVYWDAQDVMLEDVDRIEVIRGPGATLWGSNAVNGVINIITKKVENTQGGLLAAGGGNLETGFGALRYGKKLGKDTYARAYAKGFQRSNFPGLPDPTIGMDGSSAGDSWDKQQGGFRLDSRLSNKDDLTVQGDLYQADLNQSLLEPTINPPFFTNRTNNDANIAGWNMTSKLKHIFSTTSEYSLQFYYDHTERKEPFAKQTLDTLDVDFQHNFELMAGQNFIWGLGYRANLDKFEDTRFVKINPNSRNTQLFTGFLQDEFMLIDDKLWLTIGSKFEHNDYTGFEGQPSAKLMFAPSPKHRVWGSISRAVRTPSRAESDSSLLAQVTGVPVAPGVIAPVDVTLNGNGRFRAEELLAFELGYRFTLNTKLSLDLTAFYNDYQSLRSTTTGAFTSSGTIPNFFTNLASGDTYGIEAAAVWQMTDWWRWDTNYRFLDTHFNARPDGPSINAVSPNHKVSLRAEITPVDNVNLDLWLRYSSKATIVTARSLSSLGTVGEYVTLDARLAWKVIPALELSVTGQNLLDSKHLEYIEESHILPTQIPRGVYGKFSLSF
jgi:iron complex outermembrane receptor protein